MENPFSQFVKSVNPFAQFKPKEEGPKPIATTADGGQVFRMADGRLSFKSPGYATNDQDAVKRILEGATPIEEAQRTTDELTIAQNPIAARVQEFNQGAPFAGEWMDEAVGLVSPTAANAMRQTSDAMERQNPGESTALNVLGGVAYTAPLIVAGAGSRAADWVAQGASKFTRAGRGMLAAIPAGAAEGSASFAGRAEEGKRLEGAGAGAVIGGGIAGALGVFAPILGEGAAALARRVKKLDVSTIANEFGLSKPAARVVKSYLMNDDLDAAAAALARGGDEAMLANSGPATRQALDTAAATGGEALAVTRNRVGEAVTSRSKSFLTSIDDILGTARGGIKGAAKAISQATSAGRKAAYDFAYSQPTPMAGEAGEALQGVLSRIAPSDFQAAIKEANAEMLDSGFRNQNIMASIAEDGTVTFSQPLSVLQLDYIARGLSNVVEEGTDKLTGALTPAARRAQGQLRDLRGVLKQNVDGYADALRLGGDAAQQREALSMGRRLFNETTTPEDVRAFVNNATSDEAVAALRQGMRENIEAVMNRARTTIADLESGAMDFATGQNASAEAVAAIRGLLQRGNMVKARLVLGDDMKKLFSEMEKMADVMVLRAGVARGSATAIRQTGRQQMADEVAPGVVRRTLGNAGNPLEATREVTRTLAAIDPRSLSDQERRYFAEIADALTRIKGPEAQRALQAVRDAMAGQPMKDADAQLIGRLVSGSAGVGFYQAGTQALAPR
jgi:hypothetical protein